MTRNSRLLLFLPFLLCSFVSAQSLGDIARQQRRSAPDSGTNRKVYSNEDLGHSTSETTPAASSQGASAVQEQESEDGGKAQAPLTAEQWKAKIQAQKQRIAALAARIQKEQDSVHYVQADLYYNGPQHNEAQKRKQQDIENAKRVIEEQKDKLKAMQESARQAGFGTAVYE